MTWAAERPEADPDHSPTVSAYQANLVRGGLVLSMQSHHYASDVMGWSNFTAQLADHCRAIAHAGTPPPPWDPAALDVTRFVRDVPEADRVDGPAPAPRRPDHPPQQAVLFHLPASQAARLKARVAAAAAAAQDPADTAAADVPWISTYDAMCALVWRMLTRVRAERYRPAPDAPLWWGKAVDMRPRLRAPPVPGRMLRNVVAGAISDAAQVAPRTVAQVAGGPDARADDAAALARLAAYVRALTMSCTEARLEGLVEQLAPIRDKRGVSLRVDAHPPLSVFVTDHRCGDVSGRDFGFGRPLTYRHLWGGSLTAGLVLIYAPARDAADPDEGCTFTVTMEAELVPQLRADPVWSEYFEYRGVD